MLKTTWVIQLKILIFLSLYYNFFFKTISNDPLFISFTESKSNFLIFFISSKLFFIQSGTEYFNILKSIDKYGSSLFFDLDPLPVITLILFILFKQHSLIKLLIISFAFSNVRPCKSIDLQSIFLFSIIVISLFSIVSPLSKKFFQSF